MKTKENYFLDTAYECRTECIRDGFWTEGRIAKEPFNGSRGVMEWVAKRLGDRRKTHTLSLMLDAVLLQNCRYFSQISRLQG